MAEFATSDARAASAEMECILGLCGPDFVMVAADTANARSVLIMKHGAICGECVQTTVITGDDLRLAAALEGDGRESSRR